MESEGRHVGGADHFELHKETKMKTILFIACVSLSIIFIESAQAKRSASKNDYDDVIKIVRANGFDLSEVEVDKKSLVWQLNCSDDMSDEPMEEKALLFDVVLKKPTKFKDIMLESGSRISFCNSRATQVYGGHKPTGGYVYLKKDGYVCNQYLNLNKDGHLCGCPLGEDTEINGFMVPKGTEITLKKGKHFSALLIPSNDERLKTLEKGYYRFENGKPIKLQERNVWCTAESDF